MFRRYRNSIPSGCTKYAVTLFLTCFPQWALSMPINWSGATHDQQWTTVGNWDTNSVPTAQDDVTMAPGSGASLQAIVNSSGDVAHQLSIGSGGYSGNLTIASAGILNSDISIIGQTGSVGSVQVLNGGVWHAGALTLANGLSSIGSLNIYGTVTSSSIQLAMDSGASSVLVLGLSGANALLETNSISGGNGSQYIYFSGGTLRALSDQNNFISGIMSNGLRLTTGGLFLDTNGFDVGLQGGFVNHGLTPGPFTKQGEGRLTLNGTSSYSSNTVIEHGVLRAGNANALSPNSQHVVQSGAELDLAGFSQTIRGLNNNGLVSLVGTEPGNQLTLTGDLTGSGRFALGVDFGHQVSDVLRVQGASSGEYPLDILDQGDPPSAASQNIEVIETADGIAQFYLADGVVESGLFRYTLQEGLAGEPGSEHQWYLVNANHQLSRQATAIRASAPGILESAWFARLDTLHQRMGELRTQPKNVRPSCGDLWIRNYDQKQRIGHHPLGESLRQYLHAADIGIDYVGQPNDTHVWWLGLFTGYGKVRQALHAAPIDVDSNSYYAGAYATFLSPRQWYLDVVARAQHFSNEFNSRSVQGQMNEGDYDHWGYTLSAELGQRIELDCGLDFYVEPQLQVAYSHLNRAHYDTTNEVAVHINGTNLLQTRATLIAGVLYDLDKDRQFIEPYVKVNALKQSSHGGHVQASGERWRPNVDGTLLTAGLGINYQFNRTMQLYVDYAAGKNHHYTLPWQVNAGFRWLM